jgi:uncharacterized protein (DUF2252 family)
MPGQHGQTYDPRRKSASRRGSAVRARSGALTRRSLSRCALTLFALVSCNAIAKPTQAPAALPSQEAARLDQAARMITRVTLISRNCAPFYAVDQAQLQEIGNALFSQSLDRFGQERLLQAINSAETEETAQLRESEAAFWCPLQRAYLNTLRMPGLIGRQR